MAWKGMQKLREGLEILEKYVDEDESTQVSAEHDIIYLGQPGLKPDVVSDEDRERLEELGVHWDAQYDSWYSFT